MYCKISDPDTIIHKNWIRVLISIKNVILLLYSTVDNIHVFVDNDNIMYILKNAIKLMKGKALRKHSLHEKTAASVLLKLFISSNEWCRTTDAP